MKIKTICTALAALILAACNSEIVEDHSDYDEYWYDLTVGLPDSRTKVSEKNSPGTPNAVNTLQVLVFDDGGKLEASSIQETETAVLTCKAGAKKVVTLVNAPELENVTSYSQIKTSTSYLDDNTLDSMVMEGETDINLEATTSITVPVSRLAAKIVLRQVTNSFTFKSEQNKEFKVLKVYLLNAVGEKAYLADVNPTVWHNKMLLDTDDAPYFTYEELSNPVTIPYNGTWTADKYFYCYPNHSQTDSNEETWSERYTRLVIEATLDGELMYYPVSIPFIQQNSIYEVSLKITRPGSTSPDKPVTGVAAEFKVDVQDWITRDRIEETI